MTGRMKRAAVDPARMVNAAQRAPKRPVRIACVGHAALDHVFEIEAFPNSATKTPAHSYHAGTGGMAFNAAIAAARLGASVRMIGRVGDEPAVRLLRERLRHEGVDDRGLECVDGAMTSVSAIVVDAQGERQIFNHRGNAITLAHALDVRVLMGADVVLVDPRWPAGAGAALQWARAAGVISVFDADVAPAADLQRLVPLALWAVFSEQGLAVYASGADAESGLSRALRQGCSVAIVTCGERDVLWMHRGGTLQHTPVPQVRTVDTTAAGDVFHAALAVALGERMEDTAAIGFAAAAATVKCRAGPGVLGAPTRRALNAALRKPRVAPAA